MSLSVSKCIKGRDRQTDRQTNKETERDRDIKKIENLLRIQRVS